MFLIFVTKSLAEKSWEKKIFIWFSEYESINWIEEEDRTRYSLHGSPPTASYFIPFPPLNKALLLGAPEESIHWSVVSPHDVSGEALKDTFRSRSVFYRSPTELTRIFFVSACIHLTMMFATPTVPKPPEMANRDWKAFVFPLCESFISGIMSQQREANIPRKGHLYSFQIVTMLCVRIKLHSFCSPSCTIITTMGFLKFSIIPNWNSVIKQQISILQTLYTVLICLIYICCMSRSHDIVVYMRMSPISTYIWTLGPKKLTLSGEV